jgi:error-prone DNA polymerase
MSWNEKILPVYGEGDRDAKRRGGGGAPQAMKAWRAPSTTAFGGGPPPRAGEDFR